MIKGISGPAFPVPDIDGGVVECGLTLRALDAIRRIVREELRANAALEAAARQALEALEDAQRHHYALRHKQTDDLITALRAVLARPSPATLFDPRGSLGEPIV
ncbi:MAG: hypothetical protein KGR68_15190 [Betaproteobacteria bacterium]|nr:hypothetical protein [Betaproteobacteria bacterium]